MGGAAEVGPRAPPPEHQPGSSRQGRKFCWKEARASALWGHLAQHAKLCRGDPRKGTANSANRAAWLGARSPGQAEGTRMGEQLLVIPTHFTLVERVLLKTFQNLRVSSPAPVTMASPSGDMACGRRDPHRPRTCREPAGRADGGEPSAGGCAPKVPGEPRVLVRKGRAIVRVSSKNTGTPPPAMGRNGLSCAIKQRTRGCEHKTLFSGEK